MWPDNVADSPSARRNWRLTPKVELATNPQAITTTPRWTIIPPLARPTTPRHTGTPLAWAARTDRISWRMAADPANPARPKATSGIRPRTPPITQATTVNVPTHAGHRSRRCSTSVEARRHGRAGATAIRNSRLRPMGAVMRSK